MAYLLRLTLKPDGIPPFEGWGFHCPDTGQWGWLSGDLPRAARAALSMTRRRGVVLVLPRAGLFGLMAKRVVLRDPRDVAKLDDVDVDVLRRRHKAAVRRGVLVGVVRMPSV
ncbi:MAG: hypothetical protein ACKV19_11725 [Verrucomicrobiales bacterium]